jgi:hypothetical protein
MFNVAFAPLDQVEPVLAERGISVGEFKRLKQRLKRGPQRSSRQRLNDSLKGG